MFSQGIMKNSIKKADTIGTRLNRCFHSVETAIMHDKNSLNPLRNNLQSFLSCSSKISPSFQIVNPTFTNKEISVQRSNAAGSLTCTTSVIQKHPEYEGDFNTVAKCNNTSAAFKRPFIMAFDPGITGAGAVLDVENAPKLVTVFDMPTIEIKGKKRIDVFNLGFKIDCYASLTRVALVEEVGFMKGNEARGSAFVFGFATGVIHGVLGVCLIPTKTVKPSIWKLGLGLSSDKDESIKRAIKYLPESEKYLTRKKDHGKAEAILLAWYAWKHMRQV